MDPYWTDDAGSVTLYHADCRDAMAAMPDASVDAIVTDPPYELGFMGRSWDASGIAYDPAMWAEALRVLKPGGHLLAFGGTRTWHRMVCAIEDAGFEIRDSLQWLYGSGFPKSLDVSKAIDKAAGAEREKIRVSAKEARNPKAIGSGRDGLKGASSPWIEEAMRRGFHEKDGPIPATPAAAQWQGWGTALKPAVEPICLARKPLVGTVAANVLEHGTGALNIDGCRIGTEERTLGTHRARPASHSIGGFAGPDTEVTVSGRWPANVLLDEDAASMLDEQSGWSASKPGTTPALGRSGGILGEAKPRPDAGNPMGFSDSGGASRFFYVAKAATHERPRLEDGTAHPTVKPVALMRWLVRLVTPPGGTVLDPFAGSGTTAEACVVEGFRCVLIEGAEEHLPLIVQRLTKPIQAVLL